MKKRIKAYIIVDEKGAPDRFALNKRGQPRLFGEAEHARQWCVRFQLSELSHPQAVEIVYEHR